LISPGLFLLCCLSLAMPVAAGRDLREEPLPPDDTPQSGIQEILLRVPGVRSARFHTG
jgi:hypothetical protein